MWFCEVSSLLRSSLNPFTQLQQGWKVIHLCSSNHPKFTWKTSPATVFSLTQISCIIQTWGQIIFLRTICCPRNTGSIHLQTIQSQGRLHCFDMDGVKPLLPIWEGNLQRDIVIALFTAFVLIRLLSFTVHTPEIMFLLKGSPTFKMLSEICNVKAMCFSLEAAGASWFIVIRIFIIVYGRHHSLLGQILEIHTLHGAQQQYIYRKKLSKPAFEFHWPSLFIY